MSEEKKVVKILYAEDEVDIREIVVMQVEGVVDCKVFECSNATEAIELLKKHPDIELVLSDYRMPNGNGAVLYQYVKENHPEVPFFLITGTEKLTDHESFKNYYSDNPNNRYFTKPFKMEELSNNVLEILHNKSSVEKNYYKIKINRLEHYNNTNSDLFIKLSEKKFVKIIKKDDLFDKEILTKYSNKNLEHFYILKNDFHSFLDNHLKTIRATLASKRLPVHDKIHLQKDLISFARDKVLELGIDEKVVKETDAVIHSVIDHIKCNGDIWDIFKSKFNQKNYIVDHSLLLSYLSSAVAYKMSWKVEATLKKLTIASLLHDITLKSSEFAKITTAKELEECSFSDKEKQEIKRHPLAISNMVNTFKDTYPDIDSIILTHHEKPDGSGFPRGLTHLNTSPLHCLFIICEDFVNHIVENEVTPSTIAKIKKEFKKKYDKGNYKKPLEGLLRTIKA